jgi:type IV pilus assembly protein PilW
VDRLNLDTPACNGLADFAGSNSVVGIAFNCLSENDELYFLNLATRSFRNSGCWWVRDGSGNVATEGRKWTLENCPSIPPRGENLLCLDMASKATTNCNSPNTLIFTMGNRTSINDFAVRYYLSNANLPKECAPGTFNLLKQVNGDSTGRPIASCIAVFRVRYFDGQSYTPNIDEIDDINNLRAIRLCLLMQVGGKMDTPMDPPNRFEQCGDITINSEWRWYRWKLVEEDIPLRNIRK